ncbi:M13 family metallopeptidase [Sphingomonas sinipercae]|uniref:M13 family metallopeptidase n=1 Tax=Sphingomonas sinipercae TaxID=2714944 RepID=A0A6G7ZN29_9SPHN|nr:M13 family metallopeptidase [Sphingomonas sinipercae]QIL02335.1 M13 family metallopeptidase [Sphingomonas sinipercae]
MFARKILLATVAWGVISAPAFAQSAPAGAPDLSTPAPMVFPAWGFDMATLDRSVDPGDDFDAFVNGKWKAATAIPAKYPYYGVSQNLSIVSDAAMREIIKEAIDAKAPQGDIQQKVADFYLSYLDVPTINRLGLEPARPYLSRIDALTSHADLVRLFADPAFASAIGPGVTIDRDDPNRYIPTFGMAGYGLPTRDNYLVDNPRNVEMRGKYIEFLAFLLERSGASDAKARAERVYALEKGIAQNDWDPAVVRNPELTNNYLTRAQLEALAPDLPIGELIDKVGYTGERFLVTRIRPSDAKLDEQKVPAELRSKIGDGMIGQLKLLKATPMDVWKDWLKVRFLAANAPVLPSDIDKANFAFNSAYLYGVKTAPPRHERALSNVNSNLGEAIGKIYVERNFPEASKTAMIELVDNLRKAMASNISELKWMSPATREASRQKLDALNVKIGYPSKFETYEGFEVQLGQALENRLNASRWGRKDTLKKFVKPVDREQWFMTPQTVNAYYSSQLNEIVFPAAYLQAPNFSPTADPAVNYAAIGSTIGHEIGHGFDDSGSRYDGQGRLRDWWTPDDKAKFQKLSSQLAAQYGKNCPFDAGKTCINGSLTLGENIGDLAGITIAYRAYKLSLDGKPAPVIDGLTGDQRFFIAYAQKYRNKWSEQLQRVVMESDPHAPDYARVNEVLRNFDPWYAAFNVKPGDKLYVAPKNRVRIW